MRAWLAAAFLAAQPALAAEVVDATGRSVAVPAPAARVFIAGPPAAALVYALAPEALLGWSHGRPPPDLLLPAARDLPELPPTVDDAGKPNVAAIAASGADLVLDYGTVRDSYVAQAEAVQAASGVPALLLDGRLDAIPATLRALGGVVGTAERAGALADYAEATLAEVDATLARVPAEARPRAYLARGADGLQSGGAGSINAEILGRVGAVNVVEAPPGRNLVEVTPEQLAAWAPDVIVTQDAGFAAAAAALPAWKDVPAVQAGRVLLAPRAPFGFLDGPPSVNRLIGLRWLTHKLYPDAAEGDLRADVRDFYALFYQVDLDDTALDTLLGPAR
ncbi:ABC transporter substrate-binding protein [Amaricoccus sp.]|uniref:ABC transporter substrate-binding protein n=1 Tax=Amaricoccus sp. TaxID=1872485 RepID=UPI001B78A611|nr:ABC transporter substrate-binding protein [Amaricoccus sp.]MBP7001899.1 ABC transporter substrate-binding protein [Amaricoccus sp.]